MNCLFPCEVLAPLILHWDCKLCVSLYVAFAWCSEAGGDSQVLSLSAGYELDVLGEFRDFFSKKHVISFANVASVIVPKVARDHAFLIFGLLSSPQEVDVLLISHSSFN